MAPVLHPGLSLGRGDSEHRRQAGPEGLPPTAPCDRSPSPLRASLMGTTTTEFSGSH